MAPKGAPGEALKEACDAYFVYDIMMHTVLIVMHIMLMLLIIMLIMLIIMLMMLLRRLLRIPCFFLQCHALKTSPYKPALPPAAHPPELTGSLLRPQRPRLSPQGEIR